MIDEDFDQFENDDATAPSGTKVVNKSTSRKPAKKTAKKATPRRAEKKPPEPVAPERDIDAEKAAYEARVAEAKAADPENDSDDAVTPEGKTKVRVSTTRPSEVAAADGTFPDIEVEFVTYIDSDIGEWDARVMFLLNQGRDMEGLMLLMGTEEVARYLDTILPKQRDAGRILTEAVAAALGLTTGN
ncbi:hypothetical protein [Gordonia rubripertincta]|uniref:hypothetical protein n=1 Tax=Gordonia rubripertincta TaxID=36822 RepID=UPI0015F8771D|nr:hypothetical protein [Gordonia rubripertincta]QMU22501.1 hypothetical protein H3V45_08555 [Gordonia rubripertincta]